MLIIKVPDFRTGYNENGYVPRAGIAGNTNHAFANAVDRWT